MDELTEKPAEPVVEATEPAAFSVPERTSNTEREYSKADLLELYKLTFPEQSVDSLGDAIRGERLELGGDEFIAQLDKPGTYVELLKRMVDSHTDQTFFIYETLKRLKDIGAIGDTFEYKADPDNTEDKGFSLKNSVMRLDKSFGGAEVSGYQARMMILSANRDVKKIYLYNSGFNIVLRGPSLVEMNLVFNRINDELSEYGKMLGSIFYMYSDLKIKEILWDFIMLLTIGSNLKKWDKGNRLRDQTSLQDYQQILLGIGTLMFKAGYDFQHVCTNEACKQTTTEVIDLNLLQLTDFSRIPQEQLRTLSFGRPVDLDDLRKYRSSLDLTTVINIDKYRIHCRVPSMTKYLDNGAEFNEEMALTIHDIGDQEMIDQYLKYNYCRLFQPWISSVDVMNNDGEISFKIADKESVMLILSQLQNSDSLDTFADKVNDFIHHSAITNTGYLATPCTACDTMPTGVVNGFIPFDAQNSFFTILVMRLMQTS